MFYERFLNTNVIRIEQLWSHFIRSLHFYWRCKVLSGNCLIECHYIIFANCYSRRKKWLTTTIKQFLISFDVRSRCSSLLIKTLQLSGKPQKPKMLWWLCRIRLDLKLNFLRDNNVKKLVEVTILWYFFIQEHEYQWRRSQFQVFWQRFWQQ